MPIEKIELASPELHIIELDGFLNALRCVIGHQYRKFGAGIIYKNGQTIEQVISDDVSRISPSVKNIVRKVEDFKYIQRLLDKHIYAHLDPISIDALKNTDWNLIEYYGLISTAEDENGAWNRLVSQQSHVIEFVNTENDEAVIFYVEHDEFVVVTNI